MFVQSYELNASQSDSIPAEGAAQTIWGGMRREFWPGVSVVTHGMRLAFKGGRPRVLRLWQRLLVTLVKCFVLANRFDVGAQDSQWDI